MAVAGLVLALLIVLLSIAASVSAQGQGECLTHFSLNNPDFNTCRDRPCFIFIREEPNVNLDKDVMANLYAKRTLVFNCKDSDDISGLGGTAFEFIRRTAAKNAACVWGGRKCLFNDMVNFVDNTAKSNKTAAYQFAVRGLLLENSLRQRKHIIQSVSLLAEELVIVGLHSRRPTRKPFPFPVIVQPFGALTWICLSVTLFVVAVSAIWTAYTFGPRPFGWRSILTFVAHGYLDYDVARRTPLPFKRETESSFIKRAKDRITVYRLAKHLIRITLQIVLIVFLLFYEMGVARVLFVAQRRPSLNDVSKLTKDELGLYSVEKNSAAEETWNLAVVGDGSKYNKTDKDKFPWRRCSPLSDCFDMVLDKNEYPDDIPLLRKKQRPKYIVGFKKSLMHHLLRLGACEQMKIFQTEPELYKFGAGWIFGKAVPGSFRLAVDRDVSNLKLSRKLEEIANRDAGTIDTPKCRTVFRDIGVEVLGIAVLIGIVPFFIILIAVLVFHFLKRIPGLERRSA